MGPTPRQLHFHDNPVELPHVAILGAGASVAACPAGDANGRRLPVMSNLIETVGLETILSNARIKCDGGDNFEVIYSLVANDPKLHSVREELEHRVFEYFAGVQIPDRVTAYDKLLLSLRRKDLVATFNWDPLLVQAYRRNMQLRELPQLAFLHGNVGIGVCRQHRETGYAGEKCSQCGAAYAQAPLLYPVANKRYRDEPFISNGRY